MTEQEAFDKVFNTLKARGFTQAVAVTREGFSCAYRSPVGSCAAGILIEDKDYKPEMEGLGILSVRRKWSLLPELSNAFIGNLQRAHDSAPTAPGMEQRLREVAGHFNLTVPA